MWKLKGCPTPPYRFYWNSPQYEQRESVKLQEIAKNAKQKPRDHHQSCYRRSSLTLLVTQQFRSKLPGLYFASSVLSDVIGNLAIETQSTGKQVNSARVLHTRIWLNVMMYVFWYFYYKCWFHPFRNSYLRNWTFLAYLFGSWPELIVYPMVGLPSVVHNFKHLLLWNRLADQSQILELAALGRLNNGRNIVSTLSPSFFIGSSSFLKVMWTTIKAWTSSNLGIIPPLATELADFEHLKKQHIIFLAL